MTEEEELAALRDRCSRFLAGHGPVSAAAMLATIPVDTKPDNYGQGGVVAELEAEICTLLGKPAATFLPTGVMAQQAVLRVHADDRNRRTVIFHPMCHLEQHEEQAYQRLHGLIGRPAGGRDRLITMDDLVTIAEPPAALLLELPQRDIGGQQPAFDDLAARRRLPRSSRASRGVRRPAEMMQFMTVIKINAITVPPDGGDELARRFAARAGAVDNQEGFEGFELLRPTDGRTTWLVVTRWRDEESFEAWRTSPAFGHGHRQSGSAAESPHSSGHPSGGPQSADDTRRPVAVSSELWSFEIAGGSAS